MKRLIVVILTSVTLLVLLYSEAMPGSSLKPLPIIRASKESLSASQTLIGFTTRVSVASNGTQGNKDSLDSSLSADGRYVAFASVANNLVSGDTNNTSDVFVHDRQTGQTSRVSVASDGTQGSSLSFSYNPSISADGRYVAFYSLAYNLVSGDTNGAIDVFVHDRQTGQTSRVSVASDGTQGNDDSSILSLSADGRYVAFISNASNLVSDDTNGLYDVFVHDRQTGQTTRVSVASDGTQGNSSSYSPSISADGRYVAFWSDSSNLVSNDTNNVCDTNSDNVYTDNCSDVFVRDRQTGQTSRASVASDGTQGNSSSYTSSSLSLSADGRYVVFYSYASNLISGDTNGAIDVFVHDRQTGQTTRVSVASDGTQGNSLSSSYNPSISADGRYVVFYSDASTLVNSDTNGVGDIFLHDRQTGQTTRVSVASNDIQGNGPSDYQLSSISADGRSVAFGSGASNLVSGDTNGKQDVFIRLFPKDVYYVYLPIVSRQSTNLFIKNNTIGVVSYTVYNTPQGNITCNNISTGATVFCGNFASGTYSVSVSTTQCGVAFGPVTFPPGNVTRQVRCVAP